MAVNLPEFDSLAQGLGYANVPSPGPDVADTEGWGNSTIPGNPQGQPSPVSPVSATFTTDDAPNLAQTWNSGDKGTNWMGNPSYPTSNTGTVPVD